MPNSTASKVPADILESTREYEKWLRAQLEGDVVEKDLERKHVKMRDSAFLFLRATYWRWAETIYNQCPELRDAPELLAVGDIHLENFGVWRDADGRLVWGVNDFDEAAKMPYALDLVRLAVSALLAPGGRRRASALCSALLNGYRDGLKAPAAFVLDRDHRWLRDRFEVGDSERDDFWDDLAKKQRKASQDGNTPRTRYRKAIMAALPDPDIALDYWPASAGTGSLGRPRWRAAGEWRGTPIIREAKAVVPSAWSRVSGRGSKRIRCAEVADGRFRAPDPWYAASETIAVRRLSPNSRKLEITGRRVVLLDPKMLRYMGHELANVHLGTAKSLAVLRRAIIRDLSQRGNGWLLSAAEKMAWLTQREQRAWSKAYRGERSLKARR